MRLTLENVHVSFPVLEADRSLRLSLLQAVGAPIRRSGGRMTIDALKDINLDLRDGGRLAIIGHNGAGKSTLLKVFSGIYEPTAGRVTTQGSIASMTDFLLGMDPALTGYENIARRAVFMGLSAREARALTPEVEAFSELGEYLKLPMRTYSLGMYIRLAFAVATSVRPDILIMDEMINAGDMAFMEKSNRRMASLIEDSRILALASHDMALLERLCNSAVVLSKGSIVFRGSVAEAAEFYKASVAAQAA